MMSPAEPGENRNELYFSENHSGSRPWWDVPSYLSGPIRFGTWDGVFVSVGLALSELFGPYDMDII